MDVAASNAFANCPRCGYDQRGTPATWTDSCPLNGTCAECGLLFAWSQVLQPHKFEPRWCVEFAPRRWRVPAACVKTFLQSFRPWRFWSQLKMSHPIRWGRLIVYAGFLVFPLLLAYALAQGGVAIYVRYQAQQILDQQQKALPQQIVQAQAALNQLSTFQLTDSQRTNYQQALTQQLANLQAAMNASNTVNISYLEALVEAVFNPLASNSAGSVTYMGTNSPYIAPALLWSVGSRFIQGTQGAWSWNAGKTLEQLRWLGFNWAIVVVLPLSLILLPFSLRRAKVRWGHIARVFAYSMFIPVTELVVGGVLICISLLWPLSVQWNHWGTSLVLEHGWLFLLAWWTAALHWYMKIPHALLTVSLLLLLCALSLLAALWFTVPKWAMEMTSFIDGSL